MFTVFTDEVVPLTVRFPLTVRLLETVAAPVTARVEPSNVRLLLSSRAPAEPATTTRLSVRSLTVAEDIVVSAPVSVAPLLDVMLPVTARVEPLNVRLPLSSISPDVPASTTLPEVRSETLALEATKLAIVPTAVMFGCEAVVSVTSAI